MSLALALEAVERGSCLELYFGQHCVVLDPQIVGLDREGQPVVLGVERSNEHSAPLAQWLLLRLDRAISVDVSGYLSDGPRPGLETGYDQFAQVDGAANKDA